MRISKFLIAWGIIALLMTSCKQVVREMDLSGEWEVALEGEDGNLKLVTPLNSGSVHSYSDIMKIAQKSVADRILADNFEYIPKWLDITTYIFGLNSAKITYSYKKLDICNVKSFSDAYFITLSLINTYGINKIIKLYKKAKNYNIK